ncbi:hypothetical protein [Streptomyces regalis]|uniref:Uncharacterized protein n=1 Tax=Streptomyces regalis TaxID=68262 RepID=A0A0X3VRG4_9ACTN|nr:hypothetical protein ADL12_00775 [Streptomyces regalis]
MRDRELGRTGLNVSEIGYGARGPGKIRSFGISVKDHQPENVLAVLRTGVPDVVQVICNIFEQAPSDTLLPA